MMEEQALDLKDYLDAFKRRRGMILAVFLVVSLIGAVTALVWPPTYQSSATILIKEQDIPPELVQSTVTSYASQRIQVISQMVMARSNLLDIVDKYKLYEHERERLTTEEVLDEMRSNIGLNMVDASVVDPRSGRPMSATIAFRLSFSGESPDQVQKVTNELTTLYLNANLKERTDQAKETYTFLDDEAKRLQAKIGEYEAKLADFKLKNPYTLPDLKDTNMRMLDRTQTEMDGIDAQIRDLNQRKIFLDAQLAQIKPFGDSTATDPETRLQALKTQYYGLIARYSEDHPDVVRTKREIEGLEAETGAVSTASQQLEQVQALEAQLATLREKYSDQYPDVVRLRRQIESLKNSPTTGSAPKLARDAHDNPNNPAFISIKTQIEAADAEIRSQQIRKTKLETRRQDYEERLAKTPQVEVEFRAIARDLTNASNKYQEIQEKRTKAGMGQQLEEERKGERFELIEPPILPEEPISPNRPAIMILSIVLALGAGFGLALLLESQDNSVRGARSLINVLGVGPLAEIPYMAIDAEVSRHRRVATVRSLTVVGAIVVALVLVHNFWKPLDVLWYKAMRKAEVITDT